MRGGTSWPPPWNSFQVFLLGLSIGASVGLLQGNSGSTVLDAKLNDTAVTLWGAALVVGSVLAMAGIWCYRRPTSLYAGLYLERAGLVLVGAGAVIYSGVVIMAAPHVSGVRWTVSVQIAYAAACFLRSWQAHRMLHAIRGVYRGIQRDDAAVSREAGDDS
jgi:hypothetical protein